MTPPVATAPAKTSRRRPVEDDGGADEPCKTILLNCDCHTFDEVERQLIKAIRCTLGRARAIAEEVHSRGSAAVYAGPRERCEAVAQVLENIGLAVKVAQ